MSDSSDRRLVSRTTASSSRTTRNRPSSVSLKRLLEIVEDDSALQLTTREWATLTAMGPSKGQSKMSWDSVELCGQLLRRS